MPRSKDIQTYDPLLRRMLTLQYLESLPQHLQFDTMKEARATRLYIYALCAAAKATGTPTEMSCAYNIGVKTPEPLDPSNPTGPATMTIFNAANIATTNPLAASVIAAGLGGGIAPDAGGRASDPSGATTQPADDSPHLADCGAFGTFTSMPPSILGGYAVSALPASPAPNASTGVQPPGANASADEGGQGVGDPGVNSPTGEPA